MVFEYWDYQDGNLRSLHLPYPSDGLICVILLSMTVVLMVLAYFITFWAMKSAKKK